MTYSQQIFNSPQISAKNEKRVADELEKIRKELGEGRLPQLFISFETKDLDLIEKKAKEIRKNFKKVVVIGIGGSNLGAKTLSVLSKNQEYVLFMDSIDPVTTEKQINSLDLEKTFFIAISKSGETIETLSHTIIIMNLLLQKDKIKDFDKRFLFITENKENSLMSIAKKFDIEVMYHPTDIGGRYSYLSVVGLLPAAILGLNIKNIRAGAQKYLDQVLKNTKDDEYKNLNNICSVQQTLFENGTNINVLMNYSDGLANLIEWYRQLFAESIGKNGFGITPVNAVGTKDQHSQLQLYLDGPKDKFYTFLTMKKYKQNYKFDTSFLKDFKYYKIGGKYLSDIFKIEEGSSIQVLKEQKLTVRVLEFEKLNEKSLSAIMMQMFLETIILCRINNVNPFDQPAVELRKRIARKSL
jgi:glucose-6-phosphate isomerase